MVLTHSGVVPGAQHGERPSVFLIVEEQGARVHLRQMA